MSGFAPVAASVAPDLPMLGAAARAAAHILARAPATQRKAGLQKIADAIRSDSPVILDANLQDMAQARARGQTEAFLDRLLLDAARIEGMASGVEKIAALDDPVGRVLASTIRPNGLRIERVSTPLGVIGVIFESRPNVAADAGALCLASGNAVILRGGSESFHSCRAIHAAMRRGLEAAGLPEAAISLVPTTDRAAVGQMLAGLDGAIDVIIPRGGRSLVARVQEQARVPVFAHLEGVNHVFVHEAADLEMATAIVVNAKMRRTGVCGAAETLLVDRAGAERLLRPLCEALMASGCTLRGDATVQRIHQAIEPASPSDWGKEFLDAIIAVAVVDGPDGALAHIARYGSGHTEAIVTNDTVVAERFLASVDAAIVLHNASTQFADGGEFGMGAEIGIATGKFHARGPVGVEQLTSFNYRVRGHGQIRS